jgi:hypothetical protein
MEKFDGLADDVANHIGHAGDVSAAYLTAFLKDYEVFAFDIAPLPQLPRSTSYNALLGGII